MDSKTTDLVLTRDTDSKLLITTEDGTIVSGVLGFTTVANPFHHAAPDVTAVFVAGLRRDTFGDDTATCFATPGLAGTAALEVTQ